MMDSSELSHCRERVPTSSKEWRVILRKENSRQVVLYNKDNSELSIQNIDLHRQPSARDKRYASICLYCGQTLPSDAAKPHLEDLEAEASLSSSDEYPPSFMDINYFKLLGQSAFQNQYYRPIEDALPSAGPERAPDAFGVYLSKEMFNQGYYQKFFKEKQRLGKGFRGSVFLCRHILDDIELGDYAIKKVPVGDNHDWLVRMLKEVNTLERLRHPNIINYKHAWLEYHQLTVFGPKIPVLFILMELANGGSLQTYVMQACYASNTLPPQEQQQQQQRQRHLAARNAKTSSRRGSCLSLSVIKELFYDTCQGLFHLHTHGILHRDLKPSNLLLRFKGSDAHEIPTVLISDFGECDRLESIPSCSARTGGTGTLEFMAPELLYRNEQDEFTGLHSKSSDIWSLGMILYFLIYACLPFAEKEDDDLIRLEIFNLDKIHFPLYEEKSAGEGSMLKLFQEIVARCLTRCPADRPTVEQLLVALASGSPSPLSAIDSIGDRPCHQRQRHRRHHFRALPLRRPSSLSPAAPLGTAATVHRDARPLLLDAPAAFSFEHMQRQTRSQKLFQFYLIFTKISIALYIFPTYIHWILGSIVLDIFLESKKWRACLALGLVLLISVLDKLK